MAQSLHWGERAGRSFESQLWISSALAIAVHLGNESMEGKSCLFSLCKTCFQIKTNRSLKPIYTLLCLGVGNCVMSNTDRQKYDRNKVNKNSLENSNQYCFPFLYSFLNLLVQDSTGCWYNICCLIIQQIILSGNSKISFSYCEVSLQCATT